MLSSIFGYIPGGNSSSSIFGPIWLNVGSQVTTAGYEHVKFSGFAVLDVKFWMKEDDDALTHRSPSKFIQFHSSEGAKKTTNYCLYFSQVVPIEVKTGQTYREKPASWCNKLNASFRS